MGSSLTEAVAVGTRAVHIDGQVLQVVGIGDFIRVGRRAFTVASGEEGWHSASLCSAEGAGEVAVGACFAVAHEGVAAAGALRLAVFKGGGGVK